MQSPLTPTYEVNMSTVKWDLDAMIRSMTPAQQRNFARWRRVSHIHMRLWRALRWPRWPVLNVVWTFWTCLFEEGIVATCKPRWGALTFSYLNDGIRPTLWHTIQQVLWPQGRHSGIYPSGAPHSLAEAQAWEHR